MLPERAFLKVGGKIMPQGGGGGTPTSTNNTTTTIPEYARPYVESTLGKAAAVTDLTNNPYQPYKGEQVAQFTPMQNQAFQNVGNQQIAPQIADASNIAYQTGQYGLGTQGTAAQLQNASLGYGAMAAGAGDRYAQQATNPYASQAYMNPYLQASLQPALQEVQRQYDITGTQQMGNASRSGAFGGSREALMAAENQRNKNLAMNQMIGQGYNVAFDKANQAQQFGATLGLQGLQAGQQGVQGAVGAGQYGLQGLGQAGASAGTLGQLGQTQFGQEQAANQAMVSAGTQQQALQQKGLDAAYQQYQAQLNYPYQQLGFMSDLLRGLPLTQQSQSIYQNPSMISQAAGLGTAGMGAYGMYKMANSAKGGQIKEQRMADGGITQLFDVGGSVKTDLSRMSPQDLQEYIAESSSPTAKKMAQQILAEKTFMARLQQNPGVTQLPSNLPVGEAMAGGGIIAFAGEDQSLVRDTDPGARDVREVDNAIYERMVAEREAVNAAGTTGSASGVERIEPTSGVDSLVAQPPTRLPAAGIEPLAVVAKAPAVNPEKSVYGDIPLMSPESKEAFSQYAQSYKDLRGDNKQARQEAKYMALLQAGLGIAGGTSPNAFANISQGAQPAMAQYQAAIKDIRKDDREALKGLAELGLKKEEFIQRAEKMGIDKRSADLVFEAHKISAGATLAAAQVRAAAEKTYRPGAGEVFADSYVKAARAKGDNDTPEDILRQQGQERYLELYGAAGARVGVAQGRNDISALVAGVNMTDKARDNVTARLSSSWNNPDAKKIRELTVLDRKNNTNTAQEYMQGLIDKETADIQKKAQAAADLLGGPKPKPDAPKTTLNPKLPPTRTIAGKTYTLQENGTYKLQE
jgi:hypothetical protein